MATLEYLSSFDELTWRVDIGCAYVVRADIPWTARPRIRSWVESCCTDTVWVWNGTSTPDPGATTWGHMISPDENTTYIIFQHPQDSEMFLLKYAGEFELKSFSNAVFKAWHDSRCYK